MQPPFAARVSDLTAAIIERMDSIGVCGPASAMKWIVSPNLVRATRAAAARGVLVITIGLAVNCGAPDSLPSVAKQVADEASLNQVLSSPRLFDGVLVRVIGKAIFAPETTIISAPPGPDNRTHLQRSIWLDLGWPVSAKVREFNGRYVVVEGRYDVGFRGHGGVYQGSIRDIRLIEASSREAEEMTRERLASGRK